MEIAIFILAGSAAGWFAFTYVGLNEDRGRLVSIIIGAVGGYVGGKVVGPMFGAAATAPATFSPAALFFALAVAAGCLYIGNVVQNKFGY